MIELSSDILAKAYMEEISRSGNILESCLNGSPRTYVAPSLKKEDLDRQDADEKVLKEIENNDNIKTSIDKLDLGTWMGIKQNEQRIRRDAGISKLNHKRLMLGCLRTLYWRRFDLHTAYNLTDAK